MKNILIVSATLKSNYKLGQQLKGLLEKFDTKVTLISLENYMLPLYTEGASNKYKKDYKDTIVALTNYFVNNDNIIMCAPEYNGSIPPIVNNAIAWISGNTDYWRDAFNNKIVLIATSSGGSGTKFVRVMKTQLEHLGCVVMPRSISANESNPLNIGSTKKILKHFIKI